MEISYLGHACFRLKGKQGVVVTDPYDKSVGFSLGSTTADVVTVSHTHPDHNNVAAVKSGVNRDNPFIISMPGEYEVHGISVFGFGSFHDASGGKERGGNTVYAIHLDGVNVVHLGDLGHVPDDTFIESLGSVDVLLCPVGGFYTIDAKTAVEIIQEIEPSYVIPMHYKTDAHDQKTFGSLQTLADFEKAFGLQSEPVKSLSINAATAEPEQTTLVVLQH